MAVRFIWRKKPEYPEKTVDLKRLEYLITILVFALSIGKPLNVGVKFKVGSTYWRLIYFFLSILTLTWELRLKLIRFLKKKLRNNKNMWEDVKSMAMLNSRLCKYVLNFILSESIKQTQIHGRSWWYGSWIYHYLCNQCLSLLETVVIVW